MIPIREPNADDIAAAKIEATKRFGRPNVVGVPFAAPVATKLIAAPFDRAAWARYYDLSRTRPVDAPTIVLVERALWPPQGEIEELVEKAPGLPSELARKLREHAGEVGGDPRVELLTPLGSPAFGLTPEVAAKILEAASAPVWIVSVPKPLGGKLRAFVLETPDPTRYEAALDARAEATRKGEGILASSEQLVLEQVRWPTPIEAELERWPGVIEDLWAAFARAGGFGLAGEAKSL